MPSGAIVGINGYRLTGDTARLADLHHQRGYFHGRWTHGQARIGKRTESVGGHAGDFHYAVIEHNDVPVRQQTVRGSEGIFTAPTTMGGAGPAGRVAGMLGVIWLHGALHIEGQLGIHVDGTSIGLPIRQYSRLAAAPTG